MLTSVLYKELEAPLTSASEVMPYNEGDFAVMAEIKAVLAKHNAQTRFGVTLLHEHFPLEEDEVLMEFEDVQNRALVIKPVKADKLHGTDGIIMATQWRLDSPSVLNEATRWCERDSSGKHRWVDVA